LEAILPDCSRESPVPGMNYGHWFWKNKHIESINPVVKEGIIPSGVINLRKLGVTPFLESFFLWPIIFFSATEYVWKN